MNGPATKSQAPYTRDPIVEAIIEVQFAAPHDAHLSKLLKHFSAAYPLRPFDPPISPLELAPHLEFLHDREKRIFEDSITDQVRTLFQ